MVSSDIDPTLLGALTRAMLLRLAVSAAPLGLLLYYICNKQQFLTPFCRLSSVGIAGLKVGGFPWSSQVQVWKTSKN